MVLAKSVSFGKGLSPSQSWEPLQNPVSWGVVRMVAAATAGRRRSQPLELVQSPTYAAALQPPRLIKHKLITSTLRINPGPTTSKGVVVHRDVAPVGFPIEMAPPCFRGIYERFIAVLAGVPLARHVRCLEVVHLGTIHACCPPQGKQEEPEVLPPGV